MITIIGATGTVGLEALRILTGRGHKVTAVTRDPAAARLPNTATVVGGDPSRADIPDRAWDGVDAVLLSPRAVGDATAEVLAAAARHGARRVVVISAATVEFPAGEPRFIEHFHTVENAARASGLAWTFLRCTDFAANSLAWAPQIKAGGIVRSAYARAATSPIHERDIAEVAALPMTNDDHAGQAYVLSGPESLTQPDKVAIIGAAIRRDLTFAEVAPERLRVGMLAQGLPVEIPDRLLGSLADYAAKPGPTTSTVEKLLGRPARTFATWAADHAAAFQD